MSDARERLDRLLVARGLAATRVKASALVLAGRVLSQGVRLDKPGMRVPADAPLEVVGGRRFVSRGGPKLEGALARFGISAAGRDALDVGASTGGFTQVLLEQGAARVIALDVGRGQLDWSLRTDPRVHLLERVNARYLEPADLPFRPTLAVVDVSFISLRLVLPAVMACVRKDGDVTALIKPQFEVGRGHVGPGGIVREAGLHAEVLERLTRFVGERGWSLRGLAASVLPGAEGNREFFMHLRPSGAPVDEEAVAGRIRALCASVDDEERGHRA